MTEPSIPPDVERVDVDDAELETFKTESEFTGLAVSLMVEAASYACIAASTLGHSKTWDRDKAAVGGNMVRLYKLLDAFLDQTCQRREEMSSIIARLIFESAVNIRFLIQHFSKELVDEYVAYSLRHERRQRDQVLANISVRKGLVLPIEDRILKSISRSELASGMSLDSIDPKDIVRGAARIFMDARATLGWRRFIGQLLEGCLITFTATGKSYMAII